MKISCIYRSLLCPGESIGQENIGRGRLIGLRARWQSQAAGILLARGVDDLERLVGGRHRRAEIEYVPLALRSEEHTSELQSLMRISYAVFCLKKKKQIKTIHTINK